MFNFYINDLALRLKSLNEGIDIGNEKLCILLYADDIVLICENENDLQVMLNSLNSWCTSNYMSINFNKGKIIHFQPNSVQKSDFIFTCGDIVVKYNNQYMYLGIMLTEHLDFNITAKIVAHSAGRALGPLIARLKNSGGLPYEENINIKMVFILSLTR